MLHTLCTENHNFKYSNSTVCSGIVHTIMLNN